MRRIEELCLISMIVVSSTYSWMSRAKWPVARECNFTQLSAKKLEF